MNVHISKQIQERWPGFEFRGKKRISNFGYSYVEAKHKILGITLFYIIGADSFVDRTGLQYGATELIFDRTMALSSIG